MRIAVPCTDGQLCLHFGLCDHFAIFETDFDSRKIISARMILAPPHLPGVVPRWLTDQDIQVVISAGMGEKAQNIFYQNNIEVLLGAPIDTPERLVEDFLTGSLIPGDNACTKIGAMYHC